MLMVNTTLSNTWGAPPANGIDIEPDHPTFRLQNISFEDVRCVGNSGQGFVPPRRIRFLQKSRPRVVSIIKQDSKSETHAFLIHLVP